MTDELMDARLQAAGERWRSANTAIAQVDAPAAPAGRSRRRPPWTLLASAAAIVAALTLGLVFVGRSTDTPPARHDLPLAATVWLLAGYGNDVDQPSRATFAITDGALVADDSCSLLTAKATVHGSTVAFDGLTDRRYGCTDSVGDGPQFDRALRVLGGKAHWSVEGRRLTLTGDGTTVHLVAAPAGTPAPTSDFPTLTDTDWRLISATDAKGNQHLLDNDRGARFRISAGQLQAGDTCNTLSGPVTVAGSTITIAGLAQTEIGCPSSPVPAIVAAVLRGTVHEVVARNALTVTRAGAGRLDYVWVPKHSDPAELTGRTWTLALVAGKRATIAATLRFDVVQARMTGSDGCTAVDGVARVTPGVLTITGIRQARSTCPAQTSTMDSFLTQPDTLWRVDAGRLIITAGAPQADALVFTTGNPRPAAAALVGTWQLTSTETDNGTVASSQPISNGPRATFTTAGYIVDHCALPRRGTLDAGPRAIRLVPPTGILDSCLGTLDAIIGPDFEWSITDGQLRLTKGTTTYIFDRS